MAVKYKIEFESNAGVKYRVDIYDPTYSGTPIALQGGATPFTTEEDSTDDFFAPIRTSTGTLNIVDDGSIPNLMEAIVPTNNVQKAVRLVRVESESESVEWQGFLSCEAYEQEFTDRTKEISINCNSVLQAMDSLGVEDDDIDGEMTVFAILQKIVRKIVNLTGFDVASFANHYLFIPNSDNEILSKLINTSVFYSEKQMDEGDDTSYEVVGDSYKSIVERICTFMGWCCYEQNGDIICIKNGHSQGDDTKERYFDLREIYIGQNIQVSVRDVITKSIENDFEWMRENHSKTIMSPVKSVAVVAKIDDNSDNIVLPVYVPKQNDEYRSGMYDNTNNYKYALLTHINEQHSTELNTAFYSAQCLLKADQFHKAESGIFFQEDTINNSFYNSIVDASLFGVSRKNYTNWVNKGLQTYFAGAFLCKTKLTQDTINRDELENSLYCTFFGTNVDGPWYDMPDIAVLKTTRFVTIPQDGYINLRMKMKTLFNDMIVRDVPEDLFAGFCCFIQFGDLYYQMGVGQTDWGNSRPHNFISMKDTIDYHIPVTAGMSGKIKIIINAFAQSPSLFTEDPILGYQFYANPIEIIFTEINLNYRTDTWLRNDRTENHYYELISLNHLDEITINTDLATDMNNQASTTVLKNGDGTKMTELQYTQGSRRPERDLLDRMADHYSTTKRKIVVIAKHPQFEDSSHNKRDLASVSVTDGTGADEKTYIPVAESRDYAADSSEITLLEV